MKPFASSREVPDRAGGKLANAKTSSTCREQQQHWVSMSGPDSDFTHIVWPYYSSTAAFCFWSVCIAASWSGKSTFSVSIALHLATATIMIIS